MNNQGYILTIQPRRAIQIPLVVAIVIAICTFFSEYLTLFPGAFATKTPMETYILNNYFILEFKANTVSNIVVFFSAFILLAAVSALFFMIALYKNGVKDSFAGNWTALGMFFLYLSVDKASVLPEKYVKFYNSWTDANGWFAFRWIFIILALFVIWLLLRKFFLHLGGRIKNLLFVSTAVYYLGGFGLELFSGRYTSFYKSQTLGLTVMIFIAQLMEFGGLILMIYTLLHYMEDYLPEIRFLTRSKTQPDDGKETA
jgi:hypothetical protein